MDESGLLSSSPRSDTSASVSGAASTDARDVDCQLDARHMMLTMHHRSGDGEATATLDLHCTIGCAARGSELEVYTYPVVRTLS